MGLTTSLRTPPLAIPASGAVHRRRLATRQPIAAARLLAAIDSLVAVTLLGLVVIAINIEPMPEISAILSMRITLRNVLLLFVLITGTNVIFRACGLYDAARIEGAAQEAWRVAAAVALLTTLTMLLAVVSTGGAFAAHHALYFGTALLPAALAVRGVRRSIARGSRGRRRRRVLILGSGVRALRMWHALATDHTTSHELAGFVDSADGVPANDDVARRRIGTLDGLEETLMWQAIDEVCIALPIKSHYRQIQEALLVCERVGVRTKYQADLFETQVAWPTYHGVDSPYVTMQVVPDDYRLTVKRLIDFVTALLIIAATAPVMIAAAVAVKATSRGPVIFSQERYGFNRRRFRMFKFRTMVADAERRQRDLEALNEADGAVFKIAADPRLTTVGAFLRRTSIDELPQLFNVLRGEMSLVGPRPLPLRDVERFKRASDMRRFSVRPGLTCLWQISGRSTVGFDEWMTLDLKYIDAWSLALDFGILVRTVPVVLRGTGAR
jgi:exopolysaccharide biosynthesis polyprenyl glycosylphosphotransferase